MTAIKRAELQRRLSAWGPAMRLLLLAGPEESVSRAAAAEAIAALGDPADPMALMDLGTDVLKSDPGRLADEAAAVSMFGGRRVIRVLAATDGCTEAARLLLAAPVAGNPVVMLAGDLSRTSSLRKLAEDSEAALALVSYPLEGQGLASWLQGEARRLGLRLEPGVADRLLAGGVQNLGILSSELEKFALFLDASPEQPRSLGREQLAALGADNAEDDLGQLVSATISGNAALVERQLRLLAGSSAIPALRAIARRLMQLAEARAAMDAGQRPEQAVKALRPPIFWKEVDAMAAALPAWPAPRIGRGLAAMLAGERAIKQPGGPGDAAGWQAILRLGMGRERA